MASMTVSAGEDSAVRARAGFPKIRFPSRLAGFPAGWRRMIIGVTTRSMG